MTQKRKSDPAITPEKKRRKRELTPVPKNDAVAADAMLPRASMVHKHLIGKAALWDEKDLPSNITPLGCLYDADLSQDNSAISSKSITSTKVMQKLTSAVNEKWTAVYNEGILRLRDAITADEETFPPKLFEISDEEESCEDGGADHETAIQGRMIREWLHPNLCQLLKNELRKDDSNTTLKNVDLRSIVPNNAFSCYIHPSVGLVSKQGDANAGLVAMQAIKAGTTILLEDSLFPLTIEPDERALCEQAGCNLETFDTDEGPVDLCGIARSIARSIYRVINGKIESKVEGRKMVNRKEVKAWLRDMTDSPPVEDDIKNYPGSLAKDVPGSAGRLIAFSRLYPRTCEETKSLMGQYKRIGDERLNNWLEFYLSMISMFMKNSFEGTDLKVDTSKESIYFRLKYNGLAVQPLEEQLTAGAMETARGSGVFALSSLINHSCSPNVNRSTICNTMIISTSKDIPCGEPILLSYLPLEELNGDHTMRKEGLGGRDFECRCYRCAVEKAKGPIQDAEAVNAPDEGKLLKAYQKNNYSKSLDESVKAWNLWCAVINKVHGVSDLTDGATPQMKPFDGIKYSPELASSNVFDETLLFASGHILRSALLLKFQALASSNWTEISGKYPKYQRRPDQLDSISSQALHCCSVLAKGLYGGSTSTFFLRWLFELSGDFFSPLETGEMAQIRTFIENHMSRESVADNKSETNQDDE